MITEQLVLALVLRTFQGVVEHEGIYQGRESNAEVVSHGVDNKVGQERIPMFLPDESRQHTQTVYIDIP